MTGPRWQAPREHGATLVVPAWNDLPALVDRNQQLVQSSKFVLAGQSLLELRRQAAGEIFQGSGERGQGSGNPSLTPHLSPLIAAGHQPELFHPGVLAKNFAIAKLAKQLGGNSVNLNVDSDVTATTTLSLPNLDDQNGGSEAPAEARYKTQEIHFSSAQPPLPYEEWICDDEQAFSHVLAQTQETIARWPWKPVFYSYWQAAIAAQTKTKNIPERWTLARHALETSWGVGNHEIAMSRICSTSFFGTLLGDFVARRQELATLYNQELALYRKAHGIRSKHHPVADLLVQPDLIELPFWAWFPGNHARGRLFARQNSAAIQLVARFQEADREIPGNWSADANQWQREWQALLQSKWKIRHKALITSMMMRLFVADLFIHGIGGAVYDELTDRIFERFYRTPLPHFAVVTATLRLPWKTGGRGQGKGTSSPLTPDPSRLNSHQLRQKLHELRWNPDKFLQPPLNPDADHYCRLKRQLIAADPLMLSPRERFTLFRSINEGLQPYVQPLRQTTEQTLLSAHHQQKLEEHLFSREFPWVFYPEADLRQLVAKF